MKTSIVIGLGYGDEGKGFTTDYLCMQQQQPLVIRFNGGHQAGHTVVTRNERHVFSNLGSGCFRGAPTYWSRYCTFYPPGFLKEHEALAAMDIRPLFYLDTHSPVTTFYDVIYNRCLEKSRNPHGSCGLGFGATIERHTNGCPLFAEDLWNTTILKEKLVAIETYYEEKLAHEGNNSLTAAYHDYDFSEIKNQYLHTIHQCISLARLVQEESFFSDTKKKANSLIFEGAQGVLLDMDYGHFPHVTRSNTTAKNAMELINRNSLPSPSVYYVSRCYQTRHGAGPMTNEQLNLALYDTEKETNTPNPWQGNFRRTVLDLDQLLYAIRCDNNFTRHMDKHLILTCLNHMRGKIPATLGSVLAYYEPAELMKRILPECCSLLTSSSDCTEKVYQHLTASLHSSDPVSMAFNHSASSLPDWQQLP